MTGTWPLVRLALRRDRFLLPLWVLPLGLFPMAIASSLAGFYPDPATLRAFARSMADPSLSAFYGPIFAPNLGGVTAWRGSVVLIIAVLVVGLTVIRHTRAEEEQGRRELLGATPVGRQAGLVAALVVAFGAATVLGLLVTVGLVAVGAGGAGAVALGLEYVAAGWLFGAVAAVAAQLAQSARTARWISASVLAVAFLMRLVGDAGGGHDAPLSWASPIGLLQRLRPYADERWWVLGIVLLPTIGLVVAAYAINARRDLDAGLVAPRPGRARAAASLRTPLALAWRLQRGSLIGWLVAFSALALVMGSAVDAATEAFEDNALLADVFGRLGGAQSIGDLFLASIFSVLGLIAAAQGIQSALRAHAEEVAGRAEPVLATAVSRTGWAGGQVALAFAGPAVSLAAAGLLAGLAYGAAAGDAGRHVPRTVAAALVQLPAVWLTVAIAVALFGLLPRLTGLGWAALAVFLLLGQLGAVLRLSQWALDLSPFTHLPKLPGAAFTLTPVLWLIAIAAALTGAGLAGFRRRDLTT